MNTFQKAITIAFLTATAHAQVIEWVAITFDPPGTTSKQHVRVITTQQGRPTTAAEVSTIGHFEQVTATLISGTVYCLHSTVSATLASLAIEIPAGPTGTPGGFVYTFNPLQPEIGQPKPVTGCGSSIDIRGLSITNPGRVSALIWVRI
jgi:hypothetical protein